MADEEWSVAELLAAGWSEADIGWEQRAEAALANLAAGDIEQAREDIAMSLRIANGNFRRERSAASAPASPIMARRWWRPARRS